MITVIKLGGSLSEDSRLKAWLDVLVDFGRGHVVVVPGGGPYADIVRDQQRRWRFSDAHAHRMAVLAMDQFAIQLHGIEPRLVLASSVTEIRRAVEQRQTVVWLPSAMVLAATEIASNWDITSDSLAAWLSRKLGADRLVLVKSCAIPLGATIDDLRGGDIIDRGFASMADGATRQIDIVSSDELTRIERELRQMQSHKR